MGDAGVVDQTNQAAAIERGRDRPRGGVDRPGVGHVEYHRNQPLTGRSPETLGGGLATNAGEHPMAEPVQVESACPSDTARRAGHEHTT